MPLVNVHMATGRTPAQKRALMEAITEAMVAHVGARRDAVRVWVHEFSADDFMAGGELLSDKQARLAAEDAAAGVSDTAGFQAVPTGAPPVGGGGARA